MTNIYKIKFQSKGPVENGDKSLFLHIEKMGLKIISQVSNFLWVDWVNL